jgi:hypothetical protein
MTRTKRRPHIPNATTIAAMEDPNGIGPFHTTEELLADLNAPDEDDDPFLYTNLFPASTGLPETIYVGVHGVVTNDPRRPEKDGHSAAVKAWIALNQETLLAHWRGEIDAAEMTQRLRKLPP